MNVKRSLESRIRGWFPSNPTLPQHTSLIPKLTRLKPLVNPLPPLLETKYQRGVGILIGFGIGLMLLGFGAAFTTNLAYNQFAGVLGSEGIGTDSYLFRQLLDNIAFYLAMGLGGIFLTVLGIYALRSTAFREASFNKDQHFFGNFLVGTSVSLIALSFRYLFLFLLAPNNPNINHGYLNLITFAGFLLVGVALFTAGILSWIRKK